MQIKIDTAGLRHAADTLDEVVFSKNNGPLEFHGVGQAKVVEVFDYYLVFQVAVVLYDGCSDLLRRRRCA
jgi:hypothetical protein